MIEEQIQALLSDVEGTEKVSARIPKKLLDRMLAAYRKKVGPVRERGLTSQALFYFAAHGVIEWEEERRQQDLYRAGLAEHLKHQGNAVLRDSNPKPKRRSSEET